METLSRFWKFFLGPDRTSLRDYAKDVIVRFKRESLFQNSVYLMMSTAIMAVFGFVFWIITAHMYTPDQVGFATALISVTSLLSGLSLFGFNTALLKYLPKSEKPNTIINTAIIMVALVTVVLSAIYVIGIGYIAPQFGLLKSVPTYGALFIIFMIAVSINSLTDSVFIAYRASKYNFIVYAFFGLTKVILPAFLLRYGSFGIFFAYTGSVLVALALSFYFMAAKFNYKAYWIIEGDTVKKMATFSVANYAASFLSSVPTFTLPLLIVNRLGNAQSAYYYIAAAIVALLYVVPTATAQSLLAEGAHNENELNAFVKNALKLVGLLLGIGIVGIALLGHYVLLVFGTSYAANGFWLLQIMSVTSLFLSINYIGATVLRVKQQLNALVWVNIGYVVVTMALIFWWLRYGILGAGWALLGGQMFACLEYLFFWLRRSRS